MRTSLNSLWILPSPLRWLSPLSHPGQVLSRVSQSLTVIAWGGDTVKASKPQAQTMFRCIMVGPLGCAQGSGRGCSTGGSWESSVLPAPVLRAQARDLNLRLPDSAHSQ
ncbi:nuclear receptor ROR-beta-like [Platysternon megacephalum]|uniref:Nuclear receptor ROR-beta-like n=1 Tax=Platysternon megacephalum TaxID=55544 RepID=A0A4D9E0A0_9SAUR|nr:nuclear receptor ROR-beta-like [Platysternon megacephalum]